ncbi:MAG: ECF transporter S component [Lachnospiraceae bacterium]|nr:ECF transporter S component [Lachnospiraceae bacterium]
MNKEQTTEVSSAEVQDQSIRLRKLVFAGIFAAITYVVFTFLAIRIPTPGSGQVSVHLGNAFVVLGALLLGSMYGGLGGAIGLTIADLIDPVYIVEAPITFVIKFLIGIIVGVIAHKIGHIDTETDHKKIYKWVIISTIAGLAFNAIFDPLLRYFYKILILGKPLAEVSFAINMVVTLINSVVSAIVVIVLYTAIRTPLKKLDLL